ncbi:hypothetical protein PQR39_25770 [Paraburkholderia sediminicola]|uniref:hypothetical protein n=1 Tax=Paraburkholderia sediminicola TaxID=458836 RepID=UPI0038B7EC81
MKKIFAILLGCTIAASAVAASSLPPVPFPIPGNLGGTGDTIYLNPVMTNAAAATANTALIQNALNGGGELKIQCPAANPVFYTNATAVIGSNTHLSIGANCAWTQAPGSNSNMLVSHAYTTSWTTVWNGTGTIAGGPYSLQMVPATQWGGSTAYAAGTTTLSSGVLYFQGSGASCTSGSTAPTGTGSGIADGTCSWTYVTIAPGSWSGVNYQNRSYYAVVNVPNHNLTAGQFLWIAPQPDTPTSSNAWTGTQAAGQKGGPADTAYFGVFPIVAVNDSNYVTVKLRRLPAAAFTGIPLNVKAADQNITIDGGATFDYNVANNASAATTQKKNSVIMAGIYNLKLNGLYGTGSNKYFLDTSGLNTADITNVAGSPFWTTKTTNGDQIKIYGPAFDVNVHDVGGNGWDDVLSFQTEEPSAHYDQVIAPGDIINVTAKNVRGFGGYAVSLYPTHSLFQMRDITLDNIDVNNNTASLQPIRIALGTGPMFDLTIQHCKNSNNGVPFVYMTPAAGFSLDTLRLRDNDVSSTINAGFLQIVVGATTNATINHIISDGDRFNASSTTIPNNAMFSIAYTAGGSLTIGDVQISHAYVTSPNFHSGYVFYAGTETSGVTIGRVSLDHSYVNNLSAVFQSAVATNFSANSNVILNSQAIFASTAASTYQFYENQWQGNVVRYDTGSVGATLYSGGNMPASGASWFLYNAAANTTAYGSDIQCDVTKMNRVSGSFCFNTNAAPGSGTLTTSGPVMSQGTASGSWFLQSNPTGQTY